MKIRFFLFGTQHYSSSARIEEELRHIFSAQLSDDGDIQRFDSIKDASSEISKAVSEAHSLVFMADTEQYAVTKQLLAKAFGIELSCDTALLEKACTTMGKEKSVEDYEFSVAHTFVPKKARCFVLEDGLFAGFAVANGNQTIILLPFEKNRTSVLLSSQVLPYLNSVYHEKFDMTGLKKHNTEKLIATLEEKGAQIAVAGTTTADFFKEYLSCDERYSQFVHVSPVAEKRGNMQPVDYVVNLSITASEFLSCPYSVAISNAFYTGDGPESEKIVYLAVSNERETAVREVHSLPGEEIHTFLSRCCADLCLFICDVISDDVSFNADINKREKAAINRYRISIAGIAAAIVALAVFCGVYFSVNDYSLGIWYDNFMEWIFPAGNPLDDLFEKEFYEEEEALTEDTAAEEETSSDVEASVQTESTQTQEEDLKNNEENEQTSEEATSSEQTTQAREEDVKENVTEEASDEEIILYG